jgi:hypothetical protein
LLIGELTPIIPEWENFPLLMVAWDWAEKLLDAYWTGMVITQQCRARIVFLP